MSGGSAAHASAKEANPREASPKHESQGIPSVTQGRAAKKLLFFVTEDWYFWSHRLPPARAALRQGYEVVVATRVNQHADRIRAEGFGLAPIRLNRRGRNPFAELRAVVEMTCIYRRERPDIVHHLAIKPVVYGSIAARLAGVPAVINALPGLGYAFVSSSASARLVRAVIVRAFRWTLNAGNSLLIVQNPDDRAVLIAERAVAPERVRLIRGSGVDIGLFVQSAEPAGSPVVMLASRLLWYKGVGEFVEAARIFKARRRNMNWQARFVIVGDSDNHNPAAIPREQLTQWQDSGAIEWWGRRDDMPKVLAQANLVCLPSTYGEGVPKVLLEAAACGRAIVATDAPGCREVVRHGVNGLLVPPRDAQALADAIESLLGDPTRRAAMGALGRRLVEEEFTDDLIARQTLDVYKEVLGSIARTGPSRPR